MQIRRYSIVIILLIILTAFVFFMSIIPIIM